MDNVQKINDYKECLLVFGAVRLRGQNTRMMPKQFQQMGGRGQLFSRCG